MRNGLIFTMCAFAMMALFSLEGCKKKEAPSLIGHWDSYAKDSENCDKFETFIFNENGTGRFQKLTKTPNSPLGYATQDYEWVFSYTYQDNTITIDFGFDYILIYHDVSIENDVLYMRLGSQSELYTKEDFYDGDMPDYAMDIIASWDIDDTEYGRKYQVTCRADGTYISQSSEYDSTPIIETGSYRVDKSRVKFISTEAESLLNGRIFMISRIIPCEPDWPYGWIYLMSENGVEIIGKQIL